MRMKASSYFDWGSFGVSLVFGKVSLHPNYKYCLDIQILWFSVWFYFVKR